MKIYYFDQITKKDTFLGGKGLTLGLMKNAGFCVPDGLILTELPNSDEDWEQIYSWWEKLGSPKIAIRSSALGEDSNEQSFAGQNSTYLNVDSKVGIKKSVNNCFQSMFKASSALYREHFLKEKSSLASMNVVIQVMVNPKISGVYFSVDPRNNHKGWIVEAIEGLGEGLVSGKKTPWHFEEFKVSDTEIFNIKELVETAKAIRDFFGCEIDIEWSIDQNNVLQILQARPITALSGKSEKKRVIENELNRLKSIYPSDTMWDGGTFAEWNGAPSELTFSIWQDAFSKQNAFSSALKKLGYLGIEDKLPNASNSLLEKIFDRGYVNISMLAPLYFGPIPYRLAYDKAPKLKFDFKKMTFKTFILTPFTIFRMLKVSYRLSTQRQHWLLECSKELANFSNKSFRVKDSKYYSNFSDIELMDTFKKEVEQFYQEHLVWPLVLITLVESTSQGLRALLKGVVDDSEISKTLNLWLSIGIHTVTMEMNEDYRAASADTSKRDYYLQKYGHRGPGELELSNPRWMELGDKSFLSSSINHSLPTNVQKTTVEDEINNLKTYKKQVIEKEWQLLREMLELREKWKMNLLSPYSHIRYLALEISKRNNLDDSIFWHSYKEILSGDFDLKRAKTRKDTTEISKSIYLPTILELSKLEDVLENKSDSSVESLNGMALSPGLVFGEVRVVTDPDIIDTTNWPINTILVAESTDPGWTGIFLKSKAIIVEKGGVLSHCAIVAREMNLPAISGIKQCHIRFKDGDKIWVDGNNGRIKLA